jgi:hypothetical protein
MFLSFLNYVYSLCSRVAPLCTMIEYTLLIKKKNKKLLWRIKSCKLCFVEVFQTVHILDFFFFFVSSHTELLLCPGL